MFTRIAAHTLNYQFGKLLPEVILIAYIPTISVNSRCLILSARFKFACNLLIIRIVFVIKIIHYARYEVRTSFICLSLSFKTKKINASIRILIYSLYT